MINCIMPVTSKYGAKWFENACPIEKKICHRNKVGAIKKDRER